MCIRDRTYSVSGGADQALFSVATGGVLTFDSAPNYEDEICGGDNSCVVVLQVTDGANTDTITVTVNLQDVNEFSPVFGDGDTATATPNETSRRSAPTRPPTPTAPPPRPTRS